MNRLSFILMIFTVFGCSNDSAPRGVSMDSFPIINPDDPESIARWESSPYNIGNSKIVVVKLQFLNGILGDALPKQPKSVAIHVYDARTNGITAEQQSAINDFVHGEAKIHAAVRKAIYEYYKESYPAYKEGVSLGVMMYGGADEIKAILPEISTGNELDGLVQFSTIYVHPSDNGTACLGLDFIVPWDEEHGIGLRLRGEQIEAIGTGHEAFPVPKR